MACGFMLQFLISISYIAGSLTFSLDVTRGKCALEFDDVWGGDQSFEVLKYAGLHNVASRSKPISSVDKRQHFLLDDLQS